MRADSLPQILSQAHKLYRSGHFLCRWAAVAATLCLLHVCIPPLPVAAHDRFSGGFHALDMCTMAECMGSTGPALALSHVLS